MLSMIVATLTVARATRLVTEDRVLVGLRQWVIRRWGEDGKMAYLVHCPWCVSLWLSLVAMPPAVLFPNIWVVAALSIGAASMVSGLLLDRKE